MRAAHRTALVAATLVALGCSPPEPDGAWLNADLHVHSSVASNDTDGLGTPDVLAAAMRDADLDVVWITDHSNSAGSMDCEDVEDCANRGPELPVGAWPDGVYPASEISPRGASDEATGHVGCLPRNGVDLPGLDAFVDRPFGSVTGGSAVEQCQAVGGLAVVTHPYSAADWLAYDWTSEAFDALEVYNGTLGFDRPDSQGLLAWEARVMDGRDVVLVGGSDCHRWGTRPPGRGLDPALGWPTTRLLVRDGEHPIDAVADGRAVVFEPGTTLDLTAWAGRAVAVPGESLSRAGTFRLRASAEVPDRVVQLREVGGDVLVEAALDGGEVLLEGELPEGVWYARVWTADGQIFSAHGGMAMTNAIRVGR